MERVAIDPSGSTAGEDGGAQRKDARDSLFLVAQCRVQGETQAEQVRVRNLSAGGLMIELGEALTGIEPDTAVELDLRGIGRISGKIAWTAVGRAGVAFDREVDPKKARKPVGRTATTR
jgi:hypothetical protein